MSASRPESDRAPGIVRNALHDAVCGDETVDARYQAQNLTNKSKVDYICGVVGYPLKIFDLEIPFPIEDWIGADDNSIISAGLYLADLRAQFYEKQMASEGTSPLARVWERHAEAEFWQFRFNQMLHRRQRGLLLQDPRVQH